MIQGPPVADIWWLVIEAWAVGKRTVRILLECFLVPYISWYNESLWDHSCWGIALLDSLFQHVVQTVDVGNFY